MSRIDGPLSAEQIDTFMRTGLLVVKGVFSEEKRAEYITHLNGWLRDKGVRSTNNEANLVMTNGNGLTNWDSVGDRFGGFIEMHYGKAKEVIWNSAEFNQMWVQLFDIYSSASTPGFEHPEGEFDPREIYVFPDRACVRFPDKNNAVRQCGTGEHIDWDIWVNRYQPGATEFQDTDRNVPLEHWRPIQCSVAITTSRQGQGNFRCAPGFHLQANEFAQMMDAKYGPNHKQGRLRVPGVVKIRHMEPVDVAPILERFVDVPVDAGDVVFWDTRLPHSNHDKHNGTHPRIVDFNARIPGTVKNRKFTLKNWETLYQNQLHHSAYPRKYFALERGPFSVTKGSFAELLHGARPWPALLASSEEGAPGAEVPTAPTSEEGAKKPPPKKKRSPLQ
eukprot:TRINITY_DN33490_c0_g1_i1.p1 TRINITY_DN33490_c0_g1~~TRINITY_DN33490_c0_g1_i1.p1  ORF type:complete len:397 (+),score=32.63 TRINITY_DN33490_c0_g1_i1:22-1191(+)